MAGRLKPKTNWHACMLLKVLKCKGSIPKISVFGVSISGIVSPLWLSVSLFPWGVEVEDCN